MSGLRERMGRLRGSGGGNADRGTTDAGGQAMPDPSALGDGKSDVPGAGTGPGTDEARKVRQAAEQSLGPEWERLGVKLVRSEAGEFLLRRIVYPPSFRHGTHRLAELSETAGHLAAFHPGETVEAEQILFLDLETTGLGVGTGNVPFMVGIAYWRQDGFTVEQALIRHPAEEYAMLFYLRELFESFRYLATYNGRTFDWPVVQNRLILNGYRNRMWEPLHLDFLHPARSIWRNTLPSCKLSRVEEERLGIVREDDVPGSLAPQLYFQFLADGNPLTVEGVFRHNETDMLSLACLAVRFGYLLAGDGGSGLPLPEEGEELVRTGLWLERMGRAENAEAMFAAAERSGRIDSGALLLLAARDKKAGNWQRAVLLWQKAIHCESRLGTTFYEAYTELAMYYEHKAKNIELALHYTKEALELALSHPLAGKRNPKRRAELDALRKRLDRLHRKNGKLAPGADGKGAGAALQGGA
ncbi:ribonuclease H-like domain-containing protein [Paenibacillus thailandensis]|uniref:Ribonuclease H-like domain-containing protein n=1 Tax=Paenibacillus thailandensis TaxID=393250 RepID=A0ABW5QTG3_9BACL